MTLVALDLVSKSTSILESSELLPIYLCDIQCLMFDFGPILGVGMAGRWVIV